MLKDREDQGDAMTSKVMLSVEEEGADDLRLDELARQLRSVLLDTDVEDVQPLVAGEAPPGTRSGLAVAAGGLAASLGSLPVKELVGLVVAWLKSGRTHRTVHVEMDGDVLELDGVDSDTQRQVVTDWIARHPAGAGSTT
jgi:hypothetical protein